MAKIYRQVKGRKTEQWIAMLPGVQDELERRAFEIAVRAESLLINHRQDGHAEIEMAKGDIDYYVILSDERGEKAALSIEFGRAAYEVEREDGSTYEVGEMEGLYILHRAANLSRRRGNQVKLSKKEARRF